MGWNSLCITDCHPGDRLGQDVCLVVEASVTMNRYEPKKSTREKVWKMQGEWNRRFNELSGMLNFNFRPKTQRYPYDPLELE